MTPGDHTVTLVYENSRNNCKDTVERKVRVHPSPEVTASPDRLICLEDTLRVTADGAIHYEWLPNDNITNNQVSNPDVWPSQDQYYTVTGRDSNWCANSDSVWVQVQQPPQLTMPPDTIVIVGDEVQLNPVTFDAWSWAWTPGDGLSCTDCPNPIAKPLVNTEYKLAIKDSLGCFETIRTMRILVEVKYSLDVPEAFTPNGDGINDVIYPDGWGIKDIVEFRVFNRWGEQVFEASPVEPGWDGYYKGELQNAETYIYLVKARTFDNVLRSEQGMFSLIR